MPPESPVPGWSWGDVCRLMTATRGRAARSVKRGFFMGSPRWYARFDVSPSPGAERRGRHHRSEREGSAVGREVRGGSVAGGRYSVVVQPTFFAADFVASADSSTAFRTLVAAALTWRRATVVCSAARFTG